MNTFNFSNFRFLTVLPVLTFLGGVFSLSAFPALSASTFPCPSTFPVSFTDPVPYVFLVLSVDTGSPSTIPSSSLSRLLCFSSQASLLPILSHV